MTDSAALGIFLIGLCVLGGMAGGIVGGCAVTWLRTRWQTYIHLPDPPVLDVPVQLRATPVALRVTTTAPEPVTVPIITAPAPTARELAERVLTVWPDVGPTALAGIIEVSKSTAHQIIQDWKETHS